jgi:hypothetical protein
MIGRPQALSPAAGHADYEVGVEAWRKNGLAFRRNLPASPRRLGSTAGEAGGAVPHSNTLWAAFDNTKSWLDGRERHVVGHNRLGEALEGERAKLFSCDASL